MRIGVVGAGNVGAALGHRFAEIGHEIVFGVRDPGSDRARAAVAGAVGSSSCPIVEAVAESDVVVVAVPAAGLDEAVGGVGDFGGIVVDAVNAVRQPVPGGRESVSAHLASLLPEAAVVKAFNTVGFEVMLDPVFPSGRAVLPIAGHERARSVAAELGAAIGFDVLDLGGPDAVPLVEAWAKVWIRSMMGGRGRSFAFGALER